MPGFYLVASVIVSKTNSTYDFFLFFTKVCVCNGYFGIAMSHLLCKKNACDVCVCVCVWGGGSRICLWRGNSQSITIIFLYTHLGSHGERPCS